jgi:phosphopantothenoylcysteine synthetase/decarboxylase
MHILVTAGNTLVPIDRVRCLTNIFTGRTGAALALCAHERGHHVTLLTSHPEAIAMPPPPPRWQCLRYRTFADLADLMAEHITTGHCDALIHCAAVSDYEAAGVFAPAPGTAFAPGDLSWQGEPPRLVDRSAGKIKSDEPELWLRLVRAPKLIDRVREPWGFGGILVKFKLEVGISEETLLAIAERSRQQSRADWMVANTLEGAPTWAYLGSERGYERVSRRELPRRLLEVLEAQHQGAKDG